MLARHGRATASGLVYLGAGVGLLASVLYGAAAVLQGAETAAGLYQCAFSMVGLATVCGVGYSADCVTDREGASLNAYLIKYAVVFVLCWRGLRLHFADDLSADAGQYQA